MTINELRDCVADHYSSLFLYKISYQYVVLVIGFVIEVTENKIAVYRINDKDMIRFVSYAMTQDLDERQKLYELKELIKSAESIVWFEIANPGSIDAIDTMVSEKFKLSVKLGHEKWYIA